VSIHPLAPLLARFLDNVAIFSDLDEALRFKDNGNDLAAATLAGEFISAEGVVFAGSGEAPSASLLERKAQISILTAEHSVVSAQREALRQKRDEAKMRFEKATHDFAAARTQSETADRAQSSSENRILFLERELNDAERKIEALRSEQTTLAQQIQVADGRVAKLEEELATERDGLAGQQEQQHTAEAAREEMTKREDQAAEQLNELRLSLATEQQRRDSLVAQRQPMLAREAELAEMITARGTEIVNFEKRLAAQAGESKEAEAAIEKQNARRAEREAAVAALTNQRAERSSATNEMESDLRSVRNSLNELHDLRAKQQVRQAQLQLQIDNLAEHISRRYQIDLREFAPDQVAFEKTLRAQLKRTETESTPTGDVALAGADLPKLIADLTRQLDNVGPVNLDAVHEYDELEERYKFLEAQNNDLTNSRRELLDVIARINSTTKTLFAETFAEVRTHFREMFAEMFGGGRACACCR